VIHRLELSFIGFVPQWREHVGQPGQAGPGLTTQNRCTGIHPRFRSENGDETKHDGRARGRPSRQTALWTWQLRALPHRRTGGDRYPRQRARTAQQRASRGPRHREGRSSSHRRYGNRDARTHHRAGRHRSHRAQRAIQPGRQPRGRLAASRAPEYVSRTATATRATEAVR